jgi:hypothetical protein
MFELKGVRCQSCGVSLVTDDVGGGTEAHGKKTTTYCSNCYRDGRFTQSITLSEMVALVEDRLKAEKVPWVMRKLFAAKIPSLKRWRGVGSL